MFKNTAKVLSVFLGMMVLYGCSTKDVEVRHYIDVKDRVDQEMVGNAGYIGGSPQPEDRSQYKTTRKVYVLEVSQGENVDETVTVVEGDGSEGVPSYEESYDNSSEFEMENLIEVSGETDASYRSVFETIQDDEGEVVVESTPSVVEYKVEKDDTLQKISKKFYDSYSKWPKIYDMNKDVIENPDKIKPGITLRIPME